MEKARYLLHTTQVCHFEFFLVITGGCAQCCRAVGRSLYELRKEDTAEGNRGSMTNTATAAADVFVP